MASALVKVSTINNLGPGESRTRRWNNATPSKAVWHIQAIPLESSFTTPNPAEQSVEVEVTRVWRRLNREAGPIEFPEAFGYEHEVW